MGWHPADKKKSWDYLLVRLCGVLLLAGLLPLQLHAQVIDFEVLPDGTPTTDEQVE